MSDYDDNYEDVFGKKAVERGSWVFDKELQEMVPRHKFTGPKRGDEFAGILRPLVPFVSPIDHSLIDDRSKLRAHNKEHGVTNVADYGETYFERRGKEKHAESIGATKEAKLERVEALKRVMHEKGFLN